MIIENDSILVYDGGRYVVLNTIVEDNEKYGIASMLDDNDVPSINELRVFKNNDFGQLEMIEDQDLLNKLLPTFQNNLNQMISEYVQKNSSEN